MKTVKYEIKKTAEKRFIRPIDRTAASAENFHNRGFPATGRPANAQLQPQQQQPQQGRPRQAPAGGFSRNWEGGKRGGRIQGAAEPAGNAAVEKRLNFFIR